MFPGFCQNAHRSSADVGRRCDLDYEKHCCDLSFALGAVNSAPDVSQPHGSSWDLHRAQSFASIVEPLNPTPANAAGRGLTRRVWNPSPVMAGNSQKKSGPGSNCIMGARLRDMPGIWLPLLNGQVCEEVSFKTASSESIAMRHTVKHLAIGAFCPNPEPQR